MPFRRRVALVASVALCGCATTVEDVHHFDTRELGPSITMVTSSTQLIIRNPDGTVCVGPPPDATADMGFEADVTIVGSGGSDGIGASEEELPLGGRNPNVLITRDLMFQSCLAESRLGLDAEGRKAHYAALLELLARINAQSLEGKNVENVDQVGGAENFALPDGKD